MEDGERKGGKEETWIQKKISITHGDEKEKRRKRETSFLLINSIIISTPFFLILSYFYSYSHISLFTFSKKKINLDSCYN